VIPAPNGHATLVGMVIAKTADGSGVASRIENVFAALGITRLCGLNVPAPPSPVPV
jgi:hypothetical protein